MVQVGSFALEQNANSLRDRLRASSYPAYVERVVNDGRPMFRVRVGPHTDRGSAEQARDSIRGGLGYNANLVAPGG